MEEEEVNLWEEEEEANLEEEEEEVNLEEEEEVEVEEEAVKLYFKLDIFFSRLFHVSFIN
jgi:hypothetical protein